PYREDATNALDDSARNRVRHHVLPALGALFRLVNPTKSVKFCAGRETTMKDFQGLLMLSGLDSVITGGYLTTRGREISDDDAFLSRLEDF
ncbi:MAG: hypothetical protein IKS45_05860, partial [Thermoguttaceae bacterium]|nr:hypothetical protein [Thermoguttaceae bacterium]